MRNSDTYIYERQLKNVYRDSFTGVYTEREAEALFVDTLKSKGLYDPFIESFKSSDQVLMRELAKTYLINLSVLADYKTSVLWLQTTRSLSDAYALVRFYDYSIVRRRSPVVKVKYIGDTTIHLTRGSKLGTWNGYDILCMEESLYLEYGDVKFFKLGKMNSVTVPNMGNLVKTTLIPTLLKSVDNDEVKVYVEGSETAKDMTKHIKEYIRGGSVRDFSLDNAGTELYFVDYEKQYGLYDTPQGVNFQVSYLETDGLLTDEFKFDDVEWEGSFKTSLEFAVVDYSGYDGDTIDTLKTYAPLVSSSKGSANSFHQYRTFTSYLPEFYDTNPYKEDGSGVLKSVQVVNVDNAFMFKIEDKVYNETYLNQNLVDKIAIDFSDGYKMVITGVDSFDIYPTNYKAINRFEPLSNLVVKGESEPIEPQCCVLMVPYVRENLVKGIDPLIELTEAEKLSVGKGSEAFKSWNVELKYYPASERVIEIPVSIQLSEGVTISEEVEQAVNDIFNSYNYKIGFEVSVPEILARLANLTMVDVEIGYRDVVVAVDTPLKDKVFKSTRDQYFKIKPLITYKTWSK